MIINPFVFLSTYNTHPVQQLHRFCVSVFINADSADLKTNSTAFIVSTAALDLQQIRGMTGQFYPTCSLNALQLSCWDFYKRT